MPGRSKPRVNQGFFAGQDPEPGGRGVSEGMRVAVGKGVEEGSSVERRGNPDLRTRDCRRRLPGSRLRGGWIRLSAATSRASASITPAIKAFFTFTLVASILLTEDPFYPRRKGIGLLLREEPSLLPRSQRERERDGRHPLGDEPLPRLLLHQEGEMAVAGVGIFAHKFDAQTGID